MMGAVTPAMGRAAERLRRFDRALVRVRWFGIALGVYQIVGYEPFPGTPVPRSMYVVASAALALLAVVNIALTAFLRRERSTEAMVRVGAIVFAADAVALWAITWAFMFEFYSNTWVILLIASLEGAVRFQFRGALTPLAVALIVEPVREYLGHVWYGFDLYITGVTFRLGMLAIVGFIAGTMARNMEREREAAEQRALQLADLAAREAAARRESNAFQEVILAGVSAPGLTEALQSMIEHVASDLGYRTIAVLMLEEDGRLHPVAHRGFADDVEPESLRLGEGISGAVALSGRYEITPDVRRDPRYYPAEPSSRSQITLPIRLGDTVIGVLDVESPEPNGFSEQDAARLERLCAQMALVIQNARLLAQERATVERLRDLDVMKSDFIAIASHELRTPLTAMQGSIKTMRRPDLTLSADQTNEMLAILERQSDRLARLVEDLLIVSRIDAGGVALRLEPVRLEEMFRDVLEELGPRARRVSLAMPAGVPPVITDGQRVAQVCRNLIENGIKFGPEDSAVRVAAHLEGSQLLIEVSDDGPGIPQDEIPHIFERFHQVGGSMRRRADGFGLGLYIARRLVEALGGTMDVRSTVGVGTTFRMRVPVAVVEESAGTA